MGQLEERVARRFTHRLKLILQGQDAPDHLGERARGRQALDLAQRDVVAADHGIGNDHLSTPLGSCPRFLPISRP